MVGRVDVRVVRQKHLHAWRLPRHRRRVEGGGARAILGVHIRAALDEGDNHLRVAQRRRPLQARRALVGPRVRVRARPKQRADDIDVPRLGGHVQGCGAVADPTVGVGAAQAELVDTLGVAAVARHVEWRLAHRVHLGVRVGAAEAQRAHDLGASRLASDVLRGLAVEAGAVGIGAEEKQFLHER